MDKSNVIINSIQKGINARLTKFASDQNPQSSLQLGITKHILPLPLKKDLSVRLSDHLDIRIQEIDKQRVVFEYIPKTDFGKQLETGLIKTLPLNTTPAPSQPVSQEPNIVKQTVTQTNEEVSKAQIIPANETDNTNTPSNEKNFPTNLNTSSNIANKAVHSKQQKRRNAIKNPKAIQHETISIKMSIFLGAILAVVIISTAIGVIVLSNPTRKPANILSHLEESNIISSLDKLKKDQQTSTKIPSSITNIAKQVSKIPLDYASPKVSFENWMIQKESKKDNQNLGNSKVQTVNVLLGDALNKKKGKGSWNDLKRKYPIFDFYSLLESDPQDLDPDIWKQSGSTFTQQGDDYEITLGTASDPERIVSIFYNVYDNLEYKAKDFGLLLGVRMKKNVSNSQNQGTNKCVTKNYLHTRYLKPSNDGYYSRAQRKQYYQKTSERFEAQYCRSTTSNSKWIVIRPRR